ncbi:MAG: hypothetical protein M1834_004210 [Cirrosporium novae-zelandiae]|nr:MAG: hypothetical protein M1834_004210 [Cirrosporium novae-zelandiae]
MPIYEDEGVVVEDHISEEVADTSCSTCVAHGNEDREVTSDEESLGDNEYHYSPEDYSIIPSSSPYISTPPHLPLPTITNIRTPPILRTNESATIANNEDEQIMFSSSPYTSTPSKLPLPRTWESTSSSYSSSILDSDEENIWETNFPVSLNSELTAPLRYSMQPDTPTQPQPQPPSFAEKLYMLLFLVMLFSLIKLDLV